MNLHSIQIFLARYIGPYVPNLTILGEDSYLNYRWDKFWHTYGTMKPDTRKEWDEFLMWKNSEIVQEPNMMGLDESDVWGDEATYHPEDGYQPVTSDNSYIPRYQALVSFDGKIEVWTSEIYGDSEQSFFLNLDEARENLEDFEILRLWEDGTEVDLPISGEDDLTY